LKTLPIADLRCQRRKSEAFVDADYRPSKTAETPRTQGLRRELSLSLGVECGDRLAGARLVSQIKVESDYRLPPFPTAQINDPCSCLLLLLLFLATLPN